MLHSINRIAAALFHVNFRLNGDSKDMINLGKARRVVRIAIVGFSILTTPWILTAQQPAPPSQPPATPRLASPAESITRGPGANIVSPDVASDRRVTFRLYAPNASKVVVNGEWPGGTNLAMAKDDSGIS